MKYKLIKKLPFENSPEIGYISKPHLIHNNNRHYWNHNWFNPEEHPEFWELVVEKDYEILSLICNQNLRKLTKGEIIYKQNDDTFKSTSNCGQNIPIYSNSCEEVILKLDHWSIHSIKRLSDGEIFTIGDKIGPSGNEYPIAEFKICDSENTILTSSYYENGRSGSYNIRLKNVIKSKTPLFKTEDDVDIFEGDIFYTVDSNFEIQKTFGGEDEVSNAWFKKEKAEEYILLNKPCLSINDVAKIFVSTNYTTKKGNLYPQGQQLRDLVKQKLK